MAGPPDHATVQGVHVPRLIYGTAWKEDQTERLVQLALAAGFRGIDTANQRRHYHEAGVGAAVKRALTEGSLARADLFLQTKFTYVNGQDHRLPYDPKAPIGEQVEQSFESSLEHLGVDHVDSFVLHGPSTSIGLSDQDWDAWRAMEQLQQAGRTQALGVSNVTGEQLALLHKQARVKPAFVQNRSFTRPHADRAVRGFCDDHGILYQGFSLLTAIRELQRHPSTVTPAQRLGRTPQEVILRYCIQAGMLVLTGTTSEQHMRQDLSILEFELESEEFARLDKLLA